MLKILLLLPLGGVLASSIFIALAQLGLPQQAKLRAPDLAPIQLVKLSHTSEPQIRQRSLPAEPQLITATQPSQQPPPIAPPAPSRTQKLATLNNLSLPELDSAEFSRDVKLLNTLVATVPQATSSSGPRLDLSIQAQYRHPPEYPLAARRRNIEGSVTLEFTVNANGQVQEASIRVLEATPRGVFEQAAKRSLSQWRFPANPNIASSGFKSQQKIEFKLTNVQ